MNTSTQQESNWEKNKKILRRAQSTHRYGTDGKWYTRMSIYGGKHSWDVAPANPKYTLRVLYDLHSTFGSWEEAVAAFELLWRSPTEPPEEN